jgi:hypothetical protein
MPPLLSYSKLAFESQTQSDDFAVVQIYVVSQSLKINSIYIERRKHFSYKMIVHKIIVEETQDVTPIVGGNEIAEIAQEAEGNRTG